MQKAALTLFLDFDGVLNNDNFLRHQKNHVQASEHRLFDPLNIEALNHLCRELPIEKIVISSTWKNNRTINDIRNLLSSEGFVFSGRVHDVTPVLGNQYEERGEEIKEWIAKNNAVSFIVLDDFDLATSFKKGFYRVNPSDGLTRLFVANIISDLKLDPIP
jgi:HAD domain in Swiss Army Knife RNA repair proteins